MTNFDFNPHEQIPFSSFAENNKFLPLSATDGSLIGDQRRYAIYTYVVGSETIKAESPTTTPQLLSMNLSANIPQVFTAATCYNEIEIQNTSANTLYFLPMSASMPTLTASGLVIAKDVFYSVKRSIPSFTLGSIGGGEIKIIGYIN